MTARPRSGLPERTAAQHHDLRQIVGLAGAGIDIRLVSQRFAESVDWSFAESEHQVLVWRRGSAAFKEIEFERGPTRRIAPRTGDIWVIPAGERSAAMVHKAAFEFAQLTIPRGMVGPGSLRTVAGRRDPLLHHLVERIVSTAGRTDVVSRLLRQSLTDGLRLHILDIYGDQPSPSPLAGHAFDGVAQQRLIDFLHDSLDDGIDLPALAELVGMKVDAFRRAFAATFHTTPYQYVLDQRIQKAKTLLSTTTLTMTEISGVTGFSGPSHFATTFKQRVGVTPSGYRAGA